MRALVPLTLLLLVMQSSSVTASEAAAPRVTFRLGPDYIESVAAAEAGAAEAREETLLGRLPLAGPLHDLLVREDRLYVARGQAGITVLDISDPSAPVELFSFGSGPEAAKLTSRGLALVVHHRDGSSIGYDLSQRDAPRPLSSSLSGPLTPTPPGERRVAKPEMARRLRFAGGFMLLGGALIGTLSAPLLYDADVQVRAAEAKSQQEIAACRASGTKFCFGDFGLGAVFAGLPDTLAAYLFLGVGTAHALSGLIVYILSESRQPRPRERTPKFAPPLVLPSDTQGSGQTTTSGLHVGIEF